MVVPGAACLARPRSPAGRCGSCTRRRLQRRCLRQRQQRARVCVRRGGKRAYEKRARGGPGKEERPPGGGVNKPSRLGPAETGREAEPALSMRVCIHTHAHTTTREYRCRRKRHCPTEGMWIIHSGGSRRLSLLLSANGCMYSNAWLAITKSLYSNSRPSRAYSNAPI